MANENTIQFCKKITYDSGSSEPQIIYGIILEQNPLFLTVKTAHRIHTIQISRIISIETTNRVFEGAG